MKARLIVAALAVVVAFGCAAGASAAQPASRPTSPGDIPDVTEMWSSPGAVWIARQLRQVNPAWGIAAADLDVLAREWCSPYNTRAAIQWLLSRVPGADLRALPALTQLVYALRSSCYATGQYSGYAIDYWTHVTAGSLLTLIRINVQRQAQTARYAWKRPAPQLPPKVSRAIQPAVPIACRAVGGIASSWLAKATLKGPVGWAALAGLSVAKAACPTVLNSAIARIL